MISSPQHPKLLNLLQKFAYIKMGLHSFCCRVRQGTDGEVFSPGRPSQGEKGGGEHPKPQPPTKIPPGSPPPPSLPPYGAGPGAGTGRALAAASRAERTRSRGAAASSPPPPAPGSALGGTEPAPSTRRRECGRARRAGWRQWLPNGPATASRPEAGGGGGRLLRLTGLAADKMGGR